MKYTLALMITTIFILAACGSKQPRGIDWDNMRWESNGAETVDEPYHYDRK